MCFVELCKIQRTVLSCLTLCVTCIIKQDLFMRYTLDSICKIGFGIDIDTLKANLPDVPFARAFETTNEVCSGRFMDPLWKLKRAFNIGSEAKLTKSAKVVDAFIFDVIKTRKAELAALKSAGMEESFNQVHFAFSHQYSSQH